MKSNLKALFAFAAITLSTSTAFAQDSEGPKELSIDFWFYSLLLVAGILVFSVINKTIKFNAKYQKLLHLNTFKEKLLPRLLKYKKRSYTICDSIWTSLPNIKKNYLEYEQIQNNSNKSN